ncbi:MAG TPA: SMC-Scp complex subunit ScpB, partial [Leptospiraceae bacterium]|nr:SMC-Scp complex subunit ScpB [Leptospiraceae bacterium]
KREKLSRSVMETLAIISYRQPITLPEIEDVRGVASRPHVVTLLAKRLIKPQGTRPVPGRPTLYVTTKTFLQHFALNSLAELPPLEELKELKFDEIE